MSLYYPSICGQLMSFFLYTKYSSNTKKNIANQMCWRKPTLMYQRKPTIMCWRRPTIFQNTSSSHVDELASFQFLIPVHPCYEGLKFSTGSVQQMEFQNLKEEVIVQYHVNAQLIILVYPLNQSTTHCPQQNKIILFLKLI